MLATHVLKEGKSPPFVFLHGFLGNSSDWEEVCSHLPDCLCIGVDLPGHGASPFTDDFLGEFPVFGEGVHLVGYSMGGRLAMQVAARWPERVRALTLCSTHPGLRDAEERKKRLESDALWAEKLRRLSIDEFLREWYDQPIFCGFRPKRVLGNREELAQALMAYSLGKLPVVNVEKAQVLVGERDVKFRGLYECKKFGRARGLGLGLEIIAGAGHAIHLENPKGVAAWL